MAFEASIDDGTPGRGPKIHATFTYLFGADVAGELTTFGAD